MMPPQKNGSIVQGDGSQSSNRLLAGLPREDYERLRPAFRRVELEFRQKVQRQGERISQVVFPQAGVCSLTIGLRDGGSAEVAVVGNEGAVGADVFFGDPISNCTASAQVESVTGLAIGVDKFVDEMSRYGALYSLVARFNQALLRQAMQTTVCTGRHSAEQRCCRWLLTMHRRLRSPVLHVTHEVMSQMLGVRRPTVTLVMADLQKRGLVEIRRASVRILDCDGLQEVSCECYEATERAVVGDFNPVR